jgi:hypothetical protein
LGVQQPINVKRYKQAATVDQRSEAWCVQLLLDLCTWFHMCISILRRTRGRVVSVSSSLLMYSFDSTNEETEQSAFQIVCRGFEHIESYPVITSLMFGACRDGAQMQCRGVRLPCSSSLIAVVVSVILPPLIKLRGCGLMANPSKMNPSAAANFDYSNCLEHIREKTVKYEYASTTGDGGM